MNYSFQLYSARNFTPWHDVCQSIAALGYNHVEGFGALYEDAEATRSMLDKFNLTMPSGHFSLESLEGSNLEATLNLASTLGCKQLFCPYLAAEERPKDLAGWQAFGDRLAAIGNNITANDFRFGWHNHDFEFNTNADGSVPMRVILDSAPDIEWEIDVAWVARAGTDPLPWIEEFGSRITAVHVKDIAPEGECADEDGWADVGSGTLDWKLLMQKLTAQTNTRLFIAEHDNPGDHERFAKRSMQSLQRYT